MRPARRRFTAARPAMFLGTVSLAAAMAGTIGAVWPGSAGAATVRVQPGTTLSQIARTYGTSVSALAAANGIADPNLVVAGTILQVPTGTAASTTTTASASPAGGTATSTSGGSQTVVLSAGQTLWAVAQRFGLTVGALATANGIADPNHVLVGTRLAIPAMASATATAAVAVPSPSPSPSPSSQTGGAAARSSRSILPPTFRQWAATFGVPASLLEAMCWWESGWQSTVVSSTGAIGVGQLEPSTVRTQRLILGNPALDPTNPSDNIEMAAAYLHQLLAQTAGDQSQALAGYYQGLASVHRTGLLPSTRQYVRGILALVSSFS